MKIEITMWGPDNQFKGIVLDGRYGIRGVTGSNKAVARYYTDGRTNVEIDITGAEFTATSQASGKAYRPEDNEYEPNTTNNLWQRVK
jgi:hypothetical protein